MSKKSILKGTMIIAFAGLLARFIGLFFRIPLTMMIGQEGIGIYSFPMALFVPISAIVLQGPPTAIAKLVSEKRAVNDTNEISRIFYTSIRLMTIIGIATTLLMVVLTPIFSNYIWSQEVKYPYLALALAPIFLAYTSVLSGYYQGLQNMYPVALQQIADGVGRLIIGLGLAYIFLKQSVIASTTGAVVGTTAGAVIGLLALIIYFGFDTSKPTKTHVSRVHFFQISKQILKTAMPITIGAVGASLVILIDALLLKSRLSSIGYNASQIFGWNGILSNVNAIINVPLVIGVAISLNVVPNIAAAKVTHLNSVIVRMRSSMILSISLALPCGVGLMTIGKNVFNLFYPSMSTNHYLIEILSMGIMFIMINQSFIAILQGMDYEKIPVKNFYIGITAKLILSYILLGIPAINIHGAAISTLISYLLITYLNYRACHTKIGFKFDKKFMIFLPIFNNMCLAAAVILIKFLFKGLASQFLMICIAISTGLIVYGILLILTKIVGLKEIPYLNKWVK